jgi:hypothetical protein
MSSLVAQCAVQGSGPALPSKAAARALPQGRPRSA